MKIRHSLALGFLLVAFACEGSLAFEPGMPKYEYATLIVANSMDQNPFKDSSAIKSSHTIVIDFNRGNKFKNITYLAHFDMAVEADFEKLFSLESSGLKEFYKRYSQTTYPADNDNPGTIDILNLIGADGWELISIETSESRSPDAELPMQYLSSRATYFFKRIIKTPPGKNK